LAGISPFSGIHLTVSPTSVALLHRFSTSMHGAWTTGEAAAVASPIQAALFIRAKAH
jgi:hypothetical protein